MLENVLEEEELVDGDTSVDDDVDEPADYSPAEVAKMANVRNQMIYNYMSNGRIPWFFNEGGKKRVKASDALQWIEEYKANKVKRETRREAKLQAELNGEADNK